ncbi:hypothetical protein TNCV_891691 [Trichonephila clavipes]|nr:hypothetical protein TNCV_891691 [Trichonephila clavipes]
MQGVDEFHQQIQMSNVGSMGTTNHLRIRERKPRLVGGNRDNSINGLDDELDKESGQMNAGIWSTVVGLRNLHVYKFSTSPGVTAGSIGLCAPKCIGSCSMMNQHTFGL